MKKFTLLSAGLFAVCCSAFAAPEVTVSMAPDPNVQYETLPTTFTMTFDGVEKVEKASAIANNQIKITAPSGTGQVITGTISGNVVTYKIPASSAMALDEKGEYVCQLYANKFKWSDGEGGTVKNTADEWKYNVVGEENGGDEDNSVKYDLSVTFSPKLQPTFDLEQRDIKSLQLIINATDVRPVEGAKITITGPGYNASGNLVFSMGNANATWLKTELVSTPVYNGTYTCTIAKGSFGTPAWIENPETGRTNDEINFTFEIIGGLPESEMKVNTSLGISYTPALNTKVTNLRNVYLTFSDPVVYDETATVNVGQMADLSALSYSEYGTASFVRISETEVKVEFEKNVNVFGDYKLSIPEGFFHTADFNADNGSGKCNAEQSPNWIVIPDVVYVVATSTIPANDDVLTQIPANYQITVLTDNDNAVNSMKLSIIEYKMNDDLAAPVTILDNVSTELKNEDGAIYWENGETPILLKEGYYYEIQYNLFDANGNDICDGIITVNGQGVVGINEVLNTENATEIYNLEGLRFNDTKELPAGIYVINGKKVVIRK